MLDSSPSCPATLVDALERLTGVFDRGYTFVSGNGPDERLSFAALRERASVIDRGLRSMAVAATDRVALVLPEARDFAPAFLGTVRGGAVPVPLYPPAPFGRLAAYIDRLTKMLLVSQPVVLITAQQMKTPFSALLDVIPSLRAVVSVEDLLSQDGPLPDPHPATPDDPVFLQFTSGSTANPRAVVVTHGSLAANALAILRDGLEVRDDDIGLSWLPLYHDMGLIGFCLAPIFLPTPVVFLPTMDFLRRPLTWLDEIHRHRATITMAPNFAFGLLNKRAAGLVTAGTWDLSCVRVLGCGAEPIHDGTIREFLGTFAQARLRPGAFTPCYGMAEATLAMSFPPIGSGLSSETIDEQAYDVDRVASVVDRVESGYTVVGCGNALPGHEITVLDEAGSPLPDRHVGQIAFRGPSVAGGYFHDPEATSRTFTNDWLLTGDLGYRAGDQLYVTGRLKDLLVIRGRNTDPQQVEWVVEQIDGVRSGNVVAFTRPGQDTEELVVVFETDSDEDPDRLHHQVIKHVAACLQLGVADIVTLERGSLPKTSSGKVQRQQVRSWYLGRTAPVGSPSIPEMTHPLHVAAKVT